MGSCCIVQSHCPIASSGISLIGVYHHVVLQWYVFDCCIPSLLVWIAGKIFYTLATTIYLASLDCHIIPSAQAGLHPPPNGEGIKQGCHSTSDVMSHPQWLGCCYHARTMPSPSCPSRMMIEGWWTVVHNRSCLQGRLGQAAGQTQGVRLAG